MQPATIDSSLGIGQAVHGTRPASGSAPISKARRRAGRMVTAIPVLFLIFDVAIKLVQIDPVIDSLRHLGYPLTFGPTIGALELGCLAIYLIPRTSALGAVLLTGYLGGAVATHVRVGDPLVTHALFPTYVAALLWGGLFLRDARLRAINPFSNAR